MKAYKQGFSMIIVLVLVALLVFVLIGGYFVVSKGGFNFSNSLSFGNPQAVKEITLVGPKVRTASVCLEPDRAGNCVQDSSPVDPNTKQLFSSGELINAKSGSQVTILWRYVDGNVDIASTTVSTTETGSQTVNGKLTLDPSKPAMPEGNYEVVYTISEDRATAFHKAFQVKS